MHAFSPKNALFCTFLQGVGATFWQGKNGGFSGPGGRASARAQDTFCVTFLVIQKDQQVVSRPIENIRKIFRMRCSSNASVTKRVSITMRTTFGACRKDGVRYFIFYLYILNLSLSLGTIPRSVDDSKSHHDA